MLTNATQPEVQRNALVLQGQPLSLDAYAAAVAQRRQVAISDDQQLATKMQAAVDLVASAVQEGRPIYGVTTGFGGMVDQPVPAEQASALQNNLISFLAAGAGNPLDPRHTRGAMLLRANVLLQGCSGVRLELVQRLVQFLNADATPVVRELGSIGASGDLIPLATLARAITGQSEFVQVQLGDRCLGGREVLRELNLEPIKLLPKEGLGLVNGTSFSAAVAANVTVEARTLLALSLAAQSMLLRALLVHSDPFADFVHQCKPHPGQVWSAQIMRHLLGAGVDDTAAKNGQVQDRYSLRCLPQYTGPIAEGIARIQRTIEIEMNGVSDNPLVDTASGQFYQSGNFLAQYVGVAMDDVRRWFGLLAKHLDVQIALLVAPEFNGGLSSSLRGNADLPFNMGLKGLQICGNSIMPLLTWQGNPHVEHFPTHAEQFNQNINGLGWGAAHLAWKSVELFQHYTAIALLFAVQALDLRAHQVHGHWDGRSLLGEGNRPLYDAVCQVLAHTPCRQRPFLYDDTDRWLEQDVEGLTADLRGPSALAQAVQPILKSFDHCLGGQP